MMLPSSQVIRPGLVVPVGLLMAISLFWLPFGLKTTDVLEGWYFLNVADEPGWVSGPSGRIMEALPWEIAALMSSDSFIGAQLVLAALFFGKGYCLYLILRQLNALDYAPAFLIALLSVIYPADEGLFNLRGLTRHSAVFFYLLGTLFMLLASQRDVRLYLPLMFGALAISSLTSEAGMPMASATPLLLLLCPDCPGRKKLLIVLFWYLGIAIGVLVIVESGAWYQAMRLTGGLQTRSFPRAVLNSVVLAFYRAFLLGWWRPIQDLDRNLPFLPSAVSVVLAATAVMWWLARMTSLPDRQARHRSRNLVGMLLVGLVAFALGFLPYAVTDMRWVTWRVFYFSSIGAALAYGALILYPAQRFPLQGKILFYSLSPMLLFLASLNGLGQKAEFARQSGRQQKALVSLIEQAPYLQPGSTLVLYRASAAAQPFEADWIGTLAIDWVYDAFGLNALLCNPEECTFSASGISRSTLRRSGPAQTREYRYGTLLLFQYFPARGYVLLSQIPDGLLPGESRASGYEPYQRISGYTPFPHRPQRAFDAEYAPNPSQVAPRHWKGEQTTMDDRRVCDAAQQGQCSLHFAGAGGPKQFSQEVALSGQPGEQIVLSLWIRAEATPSREQAPRVVLEVLYVDGTKAEYSLRADGLSQAWREYRLTLETVKAYTLLLIRLEGGPDPSELWFDNLNLVTSSHAIPIENPSFER